MYAEPTMLDVVALLHNHPDRGLLRGHVGTVVEVLAPGVVEVEFSDNEGRSYASFALHTDDLLVLYYQPYEPCEMNKRVTITA